MPLLSPSGPAAPSAYLPGQRSPASQATGGPIDELVSDMATFIDQSGFVYHPWQIAAFVTAARTKPFVVLAGVSGLGKTKLPRLISEASDSALTVTPVKPDWTDSSEIIGYTDLTDGFHPGALLRAAQKAVEDPSKHHFLLLDELNLARVEYYLAEFLSVLEERRVESDGLIRSPALLGTSASGPVTGNWSETFLPNNFTLLGSVNMDETTHGFSRKVLDRAFVLELSDVDMANFGAVEGVPQGNKWTPADWTGIGLQVSDGMDLSSLIVLSAVQELEQLNGYLARLQLHVGYRVRDEIILFCMNAQNALSSFVTLGGEDIDPLDLAIMMKVLPRVQGGSQGVRMLLDSLAIWAAGGEDGSGRQFGVCAERIGVMSDRFNQEGFTSFWL